MITLRAFDSAAEAGMAKSVLDDHGIACELADEAAHLWSGAPGAIPVRLLVQEDQAKEALRILNTPGVALPEDLELVQNMEGQPIAPAAPEVPNELQQLQRTVRRLIVVSTVLFFLLWCFVAYLLTDRPSYPGRLWSNMTAALRQKDYDRAQKIAETAVRRYPREYWSYEWLANVHFQRKDFAKAEAEYQRAYELLDSERIRKRLQESRLRREGGEPATATPSPAP
jgi:tetratricopeptide (TPR) repeat protein